MTVVFLYLSQKYQEEINSIGKDGSELEGAICLLRHTSNLIQLFHDKMPIASTKDHRLKKLDDFYRFTMNWNEETRENKVDFISAKLFFDLQSMCLGFQSMVSIKLKQFPTSIVKPGLINQDCVENHFCQVRSCNGQNNHPTYLQQECSQNSIRFGQTTISRKSNVGKCNTTSLSSCSLPTGKV